MKKSHISHNFIFENLVDKNLAGCKYTGGFYYGPFQVDLSKMQHKYTHFGIAPMDDTFLLKKHLSSVVTRSKYNTMYLLLTPKYKLNLLTQ